MSRRKFHPGEHVWLSAWVATLYDQGLVEDSLMTPLDDVPLLSTAASAAFAISAADPKGEGHWVFSVPLQLAQLARMPWKMLVIEEQIISLVGVGVDGKPVSLAFSVHPQVTTELLKSASGFNLGVHGPKAGEIVVQKGPELVVSKSSLAKVLRRPKKAEGPQHKSENA